MEYLMIYALLAWAATRYGLTDLIATVKGIDSPRVAERRQRSAEAHERKMARLARPTPTVGEAVVQRFVDRRANPREKRQRGPAGQYLSGLWADAWGHATERRLRRHDRASNGDLRRQRFTRAAGERLSRLRGGQTSRPGQRRSDGPQGRRPGGQGPDQQSRPQPGPSQPRREQDPLSARPDGRGRDQQQRPQAGPPRQRPGQQEPAADRPQTDTSRGPSDPGPADRPTAGPGRQAGGPQTGENSTDQTHRWSRPRPGNNPGFGGDGPYFDERPGPPSDDGPRERIWADAEVIRDETDPGDPPATPEAEAEPRPDYASGHTVIEGQVIEPPLALPAAPEPADPAPAQPNQYVDIDGHLASVHPIRRDLPMTTADYTINGETLNPAAGLELSRGVYANQEAVLGNLEQSVATLTSRGVRGEPVELFQRIQESIRVTMADAEAAMAVFERHLNTQDVVMSDDTIAGAVEGTYVGDVS